MPPTEESAPSRVLTRADCLTALRRIDYILHDSIALPCETVDRITETLRPIRDRLYPRSRRPKDGDHSI
jgi:hypothetical protein